MEKFFKKNLSKIGLTFILIMTLVISFPMLTKAQKKFPQPTNLKYVNDYVGVMDDVTRGEIVTIGNELEKKTGAQATVVVINSLDGSDVESYANGLFRQWGIGQKGKDNGVLILLSIKDRKWRVEVGRGLEGVITDIYSSRVMDDVSYLLREERYGEAVKVAYSEFASEIGAENNVTLEQNDAIQAAQQEAEEAEGWGIFIMFIVILLVIIVFIAAICKALGGSGNSGSSYRRSSYRGNSNRRNNYNSGSFSSGDSSGGGFGDFGGGTSGGGGSSGEW